MRRPGGCFVSCFRRGHCNVNPNLQKSRSLVSRTRRSEDKMRSLPQIQMDISFVESCRLLTSRPGFWTDRPKPELCKPNPYNLLDFHGIYCSPSHKTLV
jgi:hypothetical protein